MPKIKYKLVKGEPMCNLGKCPSSYTSPRPISHHYQVSCMAGGKPYYPVYDTTVCAPGLRQQRDDARREICEGIAARDRAAGPYESGLTKERNAQKRGWSYLYEEVK